MANKLTMETGITLELETGSDIIFEITVLASNQARRISDKAIYATMRGKGIIGNIHDASATSETRITGAQ